MGLEVGWAARPCCARYHHIVVSSAASLHAALRPQPQRGLLRTKSNNKTHTPTCSSTEIIFAATEWRPELIKTHFTKGSSMSTLRSHFTKNNQHLSYASWPKSACLSELSPAATHSKMPKAIPAYHRHSWRKASVKLWAHRCWLLQNFKTGKGGKMHFCTFLWNHDKKAMNIPHCLCTGVNFPVRLWFPWFSCTLFLFVINTWSSQSGFLKTVMCPTTGIQKLHHDCQSHSLCL